MCACACCVCIEDARLCSSTGKAIAQIEYLFDFGQREPLQAVLKSISTEFLLSIL